MPVWLQSTEAAQAASRNDAEITRRCIIFHANATAMPAERYFLLRAEAYPGASPGWALHLQDGGSSTSWSTAMDRKLVSAQEHEVEYLARKHGTTVEKVKEIIAQTGSRSREQIEAALDKQFQHVERKAPR